MKSIVVVMAAMLLVLSGCAAHTSRPADAQTTLSQTESAAPVDTSEEEPQQTGTAGTSEETASSAETQAAAETAAIEENTSETGNTES